MTDAFKTTAIPRIIVDHDEAEYTFRDAMEEAGITGDEPEPKQKFDPNEPRDDHGRWTDGSGGGDESVSTNPDGTPRGEWVNDIAKEVKTNLEYKGPIVVDTQDPPTFTVNAKQYSSAGRANLKTGVITMYSKALVYNTRDQIAGVVAHEIEHQQFQRALNAHAAERAQIMALPRDQDVMFANGLLKPPYDQQFPNYNDMERALNMPDFQSWKVGDGVSDYSMDYWMANNDDPNKVDFEHAVHETLAEMAKAKYATGRFPQHLGFDYLRFRKNPDGSFKPKPTVSEKAALTKQWRDLYRTVETVNERLAKK